MFLCVVSIYKSIFQLRRNNGTHSAAAWNHPWLHFSLILYCVNKIPSCQWREVGHLLTKMPVHAHINTRNALTHAHTLAHWSTTCGRRRDHHHGNKRHVSHLPPLPPPPQYEPPPLLPLCCCLSTRSSSPSPLFPHSQHHPFCPNTLFPPYRTSHPSIFRIRSPLLWVRPHYPTSVWVIILLKTEGVS